MRVQGNSISIAIFMTTRSANLPDHSGARDLNQRSICRIHEPGVTAGAATRVPDCSIIDDIGAAIWAEPDIGRPVERGGLGGADERLITGVVTGKVLER